MKPIAYGRQASPSSLPRVLLMAAMLGVGAVGSVVLLYAGGVIDLPFLHARTPEARPKPQGVPIPLSARPIPAYTQVLRDQIMDAKTLDLVVGYYPQEEVEKKGLLTIDKVLGRVLANDKPAAYAFQEKDFLPPGTKPGMAAGVPKGKRSYVLDAHQVDGINDLKIGDRIDVLAAVTTVLDKTTHSYHAALSRGDGKKSDYKEGQQGMVVAVAQDALVVLPLTTREVPEESAPIPATGKPKMRVVQDFTIAIDPKEAAQLTEAVAVEAELFCVAHTGLPNDALSVTPGLLPPPPVQTVETIVGRKRDVKVFPDPNRGPIWSAETEPAEQKEPAAVPVGPTKVAEASKNGATGDAPIGAPR